MWSARSASFRFASLFSNRSEVNGLFGLLQLAVTVKIHGHGVLGRVLLVLHISEAVHACSAGTVNFLLVHFLQLVGRVAEDFAVFLDDSSLLGHGQAVVQHVLVVLHQGLIAAHLVIETSLRVGEHVPLLREGCHVTASATGSGQWVVLTQVRVECAFSMGSAMVNTETT